MTTKRNQQVSQARDWHAFHANSFRTYAAAWQGITGQSRPAIRRDEAAAGLLEHAGMLWRYTHDDRVRDELRAQPAPRRRKLVLDACRYLSRATYSPRMTTLCAHDALSNEQLEEIQSLILLRDGAQTALDLAAYLVQDLLSRDTTLLLALADGNAAFAEGDDAILRRPDILSVAHRILAPLRPHIKVTLDQRTHWWLFHAAKLDQQFENELREPLFPSKLGLPTPTRPILKYPSPVILDTSHISAAAQMAAKTPGTHSLFATTRRSLESILSAAKGGRASTRRPAPVRAAATCIPLVVPLQAKPENPSSPVAQWDAAGLPNVPNHPAEVLVLHKPSGTLLGIAYFDPASKTITLIEGAWNTCAPYADHPDNLLLICSLSS